MEELSLISRQEPGIATIDNFQELKQALEQQLEAYKSLAYSQDSVKAAKKDIHLRRAIWINCKENSIK